MPQVLPGHPLLPTPRVWLKKRRGGPRNPGVGPVLPSCLVPALGGPINLENTEGGLAPLFLGGTAMLCPLLINLGVGPACAAQQPVRPPRAGLCGARWKCPGHTPS